MNVRTQRLAHVVADLCSPEAAGRGPGTPGGAYARGIVEEAMAQIGLEPFGTDGYRQPLPTGAVNLIGRLAGSSGRTLVLAAHYDHLGTIDGTVFPGANDNASGVAVMLEVASALVAGPALERSVLLCAFDAEEPPHFLTPHMGSQWFVDHRPPGLGPIDLMMCLDIVGTRLGPAGLPSEVGESIFVQGAETSRGTADLIDALPAVPGIRPRHIPDWLIPPMSDHDAFRAAGIPWVFYTVGRDQRYHTPEDTEEHLDYPKMAALVDHLTSLVTAAADPAYRPDYFDRPARDHAVIDTLRAILEPVADLAPEADLALDMVGSLADEMPDGRLPDESRRVIQMLALQMEDSLG